jgi:hypothetical protein
VHFALIAKVFRLTILKGEEVKNPTTCCGALGEREPHTNYNKAAFIPPAS